MRLSDAMGRRRRLACAAPRLAAKYTLAGAENKLLAVMLTDSLAIDGGVLSI
jgi:hypothetical protein